MAAIRVFDACFPEKAPPPAHPPTASFGDPDEAAPENAVRLGRVPLTESVVFHS